RSGVVLQPRRFMGPGYLHYRSGGRAATGTADLHDCAVAGRERARVPVDDPVHAAQQAKSHRLDGGALRWRAPGRTGVSAASETGSDLGPAAGGGADQSGSEYFEGPDAVEPAGVAGAAQPDSHAAD